jgi:hypothetical protein
MNRFHSLSRLALPALSLSLLAGVLGVLGPVGISQAAVGDGAGSSQILIGKDDDNVGNVAIQAGAVANQSLNRADVIVGGPGNDVIFGLNGDDVIDGGPGRDIILGGPDGGAAPGGPPNSDIMSGGPGNDVNLWAAGDGSEAFLGGPGVDALVFGATDRETVADPQTGVRLPSLRFLAPEFPAGIPTADVSGQPQHCTIEPSPLASYDFLVRFRGPANNIIVTVRVRDVEQVFCTSEHGSAIAFADLTRPSPTFVDVAPFEVERLNGLVAAMIR